LSLKIRDPDVESTRVENPLAVLRSRHILVVDADPTSLETTKSVLAFGGYDNVVGTTDPRQGEDLVRSGKFDLVLTDRWVSEYDGFDLLRLVHSRDARLPVLVMTDDDSMATAVEALRLKAADILFKPLLAEQLIGRIDAILRDRSSRRGREVALAIGAHPDDVEIGAGAALLAHRARGDRVAILVMSNGARGGMALERAREAAAAADLLGAELILGTLEDTRILDHGKTVDLVEESIDWVGATRIYTHSGQDRHQDHRNTHAAVMIASRQVPHVYGFQSPSSTIDYRPTRFEAMDDYLEQKVALIACHKSQVAFRDYLDEDFTVATARYWGRFSASRYAEPFEVFRDVQGASLPSTVRQSVSEGQQWIEDAPRSRVVSPAYPNE
jgi:two-component system response regulator HydG